VNSVVASIVSLNVSSLNNTSDNKCKELLPTKLQFKVNKKPMWIGITDVVSIVEKGQLAHLGRMLCIGAHC
jgi:hypothetical protein